MDNWQPIETAPKDGTPILATNYRYQYLLGRCLVVYWDDDEDKNNGWALPSDEEGATRHDYLTHWMPLPEPPNEK